MFNGALHCCVKQLHAAELLLSACQIRSAWEHPSAQQIARTRVEFLDAAQFLQGYDRACEPMEAKQEDSKEADTAATNQNRELFKRFEVCICCCCYPGSCKAWCAVYSQGLLCMLQVQKLLGKGSYGIVYRVKRLSDGGVYALKEADVRKMSPLERADAVNEIRLLASVKHQNVVRYHEAFLDGRGSTPAYMQDGKTCTCTVTKICECR